MRTKKSPANARLSCLLIRQQSFVGIEAGKSNRHFWDDTRQNSPKTLVQGQRRFSSNNVRSCGNKTSWF